MGKRVEAERFKRQFALIPTVGFTYHGNEYKFNVAFMWLWFGLRIGVWRR